ncbi:hypothetical protein AB1Y20_023315 [Prymnesium parvum]|uniref:Uncharacterized protein n=1 Tax=Prymnesium parvum TaxID=97485 RepID=A0AB34JFU9_PRYPA
MSATNTIIEKQEEARMVATAAKRKLQRVQGALEALDALAHTSDEYSASIIAAEVAVRQSHAELSTLLEQTDGGDTLQRARHEWFQASAQTDYVRLHDQLVQYRPAMEAAEAEALNCWEQMQPWRAKIREAKMNLATCQGRLYALLELGFKLPNNLESAVQEQRRMWMEERQQTEALMEKQSELVYQRRERKQLFQREQGWRKAVERFGGLLGLGPEALLAVRLQILESDEVEMRTVSKARVRVLDNSVKVHEVASAELHGATGAIGFLSQFKERVPTDDILRAEEYEASLELQMIKGALQEIKPKTDEALHLRLGWQSAVGGHKIADLLASPDLASMAEALSDAQEAVVASEPARSEKIALEAFHGKVQGRLQAIGAVRMAVAATSDSYEVAAEMDRLLSSAKLAHLRLSMKTADLRLMLLRHEKAQANLHCSGGALICIKRLQRRIALEPEKARLLTMRKAELQPVEAKPQGSYTKAMRAYVRGFLKPMIRAALRSLLVQRPADSFSFLIDFFWRHSEACRLDNSIEGAVDLARSGMDLGPREEKLAKLQEELQMTVSSLNYTVDVSGQVLGAAQMLRMMLDPLPQQYIVFNDGADAPQGEAHAGTHMQASAYAVLENASTVYHDSAVLSFNNSQVLDAVATVLQHYPQVMLQVHTTVEHLSPLVSACLLHVPRGENVPPQLSDADVLAWKRSSKVVQALVERGISALRLSASAPGHTGGLEPQGPFTMHAMPSLDDSSSPAEATTSIVSSAASKHASRLYWAAVSNRGRLAECRAHEQLLLSRLDLQLEDAMAEFNQLFDFASSRLLLSQSISLIANVTQVSTSALAESPSAAEQVDTGAQIYLAFGADRADSHWAQFEVHDMAVEHLDVELWNAPGHRLLGSSFISVKPLLTFEKRSMDLALPLTSVGGLVVGAVRIQIHTEALK